MADAVGQRSPSGTLKLLFAEGTMKAGPLGQACEECGLAWSLPQLSWDSVVPPTRLLLSADYSVSTKRAYCWETLSWFPSADGGGGPRRPEAAGLPALELHLSEICSRLSHPSAGPGGPSMPLHSRSLRRHLAKLNRFSSFNLSSLAGNLERKQMLTPYRFKLLL